MSNIELIIFDFDGVIVDSEHIYNKANKAAFIHAGIVMSDHEVNTRFIGMDFGSMLDMFTNDYGAERTLLYKNHVDVESRRLIDQELAAIPHIIEFLETTHLPYYIASNAHTEWTEHKIQLLDIGHLFGDILVGTNSVPKPKPAPDMFKLAADKAGIAYDKCVVIEDGIYGIQAAKHLGMAPLGFTGQIFKLPNHHETLTQAGAILTFDDMRKLPNIIAGL
ncbi:MAG: HAD family phosphatase [Rhizobiales bacterium]|nr:HAD family phosphatase [Hyphomicrobiales bacterium]NRB14671.1 HAD family phosphatase [Hyphomicrobiales bacterium]